ncbi:ClpP/crotonase-like domain-containing protein [Polychytrium aggregatum]|uniref:ClpP/crotonase-like domain-containing protein n=1 Tax=Polychytrium aggregatum TaxID=110093 RepID=UPI0022FE52FC|nr:ClpP/crotonase-like domain-containing protein [Polychytrium aggregatum]KAI9203061.1 ClpP/crotonase-like domain-containing protein [Polychytrium aggregatum]
MLRLVRVQLLRPIRHHIRPLPVPRAAPVPHGRFAVQQPCIIFRSLSSTSARCNESTPVLANGDTESTSERIPETSLDQHKPGSGPVLEPVAEPIPSPVPTVQIYHQRKGRVMVLNRPESLNALTEEMITAILDNFQAWDQTDINALVIEESEDGRAFCAGVDAIRLAELINEKTDESRAKALGLLNKTYTAQHLLATLDTPLVAILDGITMGGGLGLAIHAPVRLATEETVVSVAEGRVGFFIGGGVSFFLSRMPDGDPVGKFLALSGYKLKGIETVMAGIATHYIPSERIPSLIARLGALESSDIRAINLIINEFVGSAPSTDDWKNWILGGERGDLIQRCFAKDTLPEILRALEAEKSEFASEIIKLIRRQRPQYLLLTLKQLKMADTMDLASCFRMDYQIAKAMIHDTDSEFSEGVRLVLKEKSPEPIQWSPDLETVLGNIKQYQKQIDTQFLPQLDFGAKSEELPLLTDRTYKFYAHRTVTGLPSIEDVRIVVTGEVKSVGEFALTRQEVIDWFAKNWGTFLDDDDLDQTSRLPKELTGGAKYFVENWRDPAQTPGERRREMWGVRQRVEDILDRKTTVIGDGYLKWKA